MKAQITIVLDKERVAALYDEWQASGGSMLFSTWLEHHIMGASEDLTSPFGGKAECTVTKLSMSDGELAALVEAGRERHQ